MGGATDTYEDLDAGATWVLREGDPVPKPLASPGRAQATDGGAAGSGPSEAGASETQAEMTTDQLTDREKIARFWQLQRAGMDAIKTEQDPAKAAGLFRQALELNPDHGDAHYYLAASLASLGQTDEALQHLRRLTEINPQSQRAFKRWGTLRALTAETNEHLECRPRPRALPQAQQRRDRQPPRPGRDRPPPRRPRPRPPTPELGHHHQPTRRRRPVPPRLPGVEGG